MSESRLGFVGILVSDRIDAAPRVNAVLSEYGESIVARTGIPYREKNCCVITLIVDMSNDAIGALTGKLGALPGVSVKSALVGAKS